MPPIVQFSALLSVMCAVACGNVVSDTSAGLGAENSINITRLLGTTTIFVGIASLLTATFLVVVAKLFYKKGDPRVEKVLDSLPHAECGACGFAGCESYAEAVINDPSVPPNLCVPGGRRTAAAVALISSKTAATKAHSFARVFCGGGVNNAKSRGVYHGPKDCKTAFSTAGGDKICSAGCLGYGSCVNICPFGAITMDNNRLPVIDTGKCVGCRKCEEYCPKKVFVMSATTIATAIVACHATGKGAEKRTFCSAACIGCGICVKVCPVAAPAVQNGLAVIDPLKCTACGACVGKCPTRAIVMTGDTPTRSGSTRR